MLQLIIFMCITQIVLTVPVYYEKDYDEGSILVANLNFGERILPTTTPTETPKISTSFNVTKVESDEPIKSLKNTFSYAELIDNQPINTVHITKLPFFSTFNIPWLSQISFHDSNSNEQETLNETTIQATGFTDDFINGNNSSEIDIDTVTDNKTNTDNATIIKERDIPEIKNSTLLSKNLKINNESISTTTSLELKTSTTAATTTSLELKTSTIAVTTPATITASSTSTTSLNSTTATPSTTTMEDSDKDNKTDKIEDTKEKKEEEIEKIKKMVKQKIAEVAAAPIILTQVV